MELKKKKWTEIHRPTCQETTGYDQDNDLYIRCGMPAFTLVKHRGRNEGPYWMCPACAWHNVNNRDAEDITSED